MSALFTFIRNSLLVTSLDIDNAMYMTSVVDQVTPRKRQKALIFWGFVIEYLARLFLIIFFQNVFSGSQPLFELFGIPFSIETISLMAAGIFLTIRSGRELVAYIRGGDEAEITASEIEGKSFSQILTEMSLVCIVLSIDTIVAVMATGFPFWYLALILFMSALIRFFFISPIARFLQNYPNVTVIILTFLLIIGVSLVLEGFGLQLPEVLINLILALVVLIVIFIEKQRTRSYHNKLLASWENALNSKQEKEQND